jgi:uncharacterized membrane protein SpoIIM required for sporulation
MTPLQFESRYAADWAALEEQVRCRQQRRRKGKDQPLMPADRFAALYRRVCEQLSLARDRAYPAHVVDRLQAVAADAHQLLYQQGGRTTFAALRAFLLHGFPHAVYRHRRHVALSAVLFTLPLLVIGVLMYLRPDLILTMMDAAAAQEMESMYSRDAESIGRRRDATTDWAMFGFYINNNIGVAFRCFAGGLFLGVGSIFFIVYNGALIGAVGGFLTERGLGATFYAFVATHSSFELIAIVLSGAAGLRLGQALVAPGRLTRRASLVQATRDTTPLIYGFTILLLIAAAVEAFWSSAPWIPPLVKYPVAAACWIGLLAYLILQGRRAR